MNIEVQPQKILYDGTTMFVRIGFLFDGVLKSIRVSEESPMDKFQITSASPDRLIELANMAMNSIVEVVERKSQQGVLPEDITVKSGEI